MLCEQPIRNQVHLKVFLLVRSCGTPRGCGGLLVRTDPFNKKQLRLHQPPGINFLS